MERQCGERFDMIYTTLESHIVEVRGQAAPSALVDLAELRWLLKDRRVNKRDRVRLRLSDAGVPLLPGWHPVVLKEVELSRPIIGGRVRAAGKVVRPKELASFSVPATREI